MDLSHLTPHTSTVELALTWNWELHKLQLDGVHTDMCAYLRPSTRFHQRTVDVGDRTVMA
jgi:hypothetical protein